MMVSVQQTFDLHLSSILRACSTSYGSRKVIHMHKRKWYDHKMEFDFSIVQPFTLTLDSLLRGKD